MKYISFFSNFNFFIISFYLLYLSRKKLQELHNLKAIFNNFETLNIKDIFLVLIMGHLGIISMAANILTEDK
jgi:hypothetical protein